MGQEATAVFAASNVTFAAITEPGPAVITDLDAQELTTGGARADGLLSEVTLSAKEITRAKQYWGNTSGLYQRAGPSQKAEALAFHLVEFTTSDPAPGQITWKYLEPAKCLI
jgi:hypothetical protein